MSKVGRATSVLRPFSVPHIFPGLVFRVLIPKEYLTSTLEDQALYVKDDLLAHNYISVRMCNVLRCSWVSSKLPVDG
jgi:hypothetical protein